MLVNNIDISYFKAKLMNRKIVNSEFDIVNDWSTNSLTPFVDEKIRYKYKTLTLTLDIICSNANELEIMKSNLVKQLSISTIKFDDIDYYYKGFVIGDISPTYIMKGNETLDITMLVIAEKEQIIETMNRITSKTINIAGNVETPAIVEITPTINLISITITGLGEDFIIKNLTSGQTVIINGEEGTVLQNNINKFMDYDGWEFPLLAPGSNTITLSNANCNVNIKYKPRWI